MPRVELNGQFIEFPEESYYEHLIGLVYSSCALAGMIGAPRSIPDSGQSLTSKHKEHFTSSIRSIDDSQLRELFDQFLDQWSQVEELNKKIIAAFAEKAGVNNPASRKEFQRLDRDLKKSLGPNWYPELLAEENIRPILDQVLKGIESMNQTKIKILRQIVKMYPELKKSEYIDPRDRRKIKVFPSLMDLELFFGKLLYRKKPGNSGNQ